MKCLLIDDHALFREALSLLMTHRHPEVPLVNCGTLADGLVALAAAPDISLVLLDLNLPDSRGVATLQRLREAAPMPRVIVVSADDRAETIMNAIDAGAVGFIPKTADIEALDAGLRTVLAGGIAMPRLMHSTVPVHDMLPGTLSDMGLTPRQLDVFRLVIEGKSNKLIARELGVSDSTVKTHVQAIFERLDISSRAQAVVVAARMGWELPAPSR